jgi:hypothetical protein
MNVLVHFARIAPPARRTAAQTEKQFMEAVIEYARLCGWLVYHPFDSRRSEAGWPDLAMVRDEILLIVELKTERGRVSKAQQMWLEALSKVAAFCPNMRVRLWRPSDWPQIELELAR